MAKLVSKTYGDALFAVAKEEDKLDLFNEAVQMVADLLREHADFSKLMSHPRIAKEEKISILEETFDEKIPRELVGLLCMLVEKGHTEQMISVCEHFLRLVKEERGIGEAHVTSAVVLTASQKEKIENKLLKTTGYKSLEMEYHVDATLIGGMVIRIGDRVVDSSIQTKLQRLSKELRNVQV